MEDKIRDLEIRMTKVETKVDDIREDIKEIKNFQKQNMFWLITTLSTSLITLGSLLINMVG